MSGSASQFYVTGPAYVFVQLGSGSPPAYEFLGFTESGLRMSFNPMNEDIQVDYAGNVPGDVSQLGQDATISGTFTRYNEPVANQVISFVGNSNPGNSIPGSYLNNQMGSLMVLEGAAYGLLIVFAYGSASGNKTEFSNMIPGYLFPAAYLNNPAEFTVSVKRKAPEFTFRAIPVFGNFTGSTFTANAAPYNASQLYTTNTANWPSPLPNVT